MSPSTRFFTSLALAALPCFVACNGCKESEETPNKPPQDVTIDKPDFNPDSAYAYIQAQVNFGPRVPGTPAQQQCAAWMEQKLKEFCDTVYRQDVTVKAGNGKSLPCINLVGAINPGATKRVLLLAHWDSRPWADMDTKDTGKAIVAADDGGSGVGVLIELARQFNGKPLPEDIGVDILLTDVEDYGREEWGENSYALGTQYWARNPHVPGYRANFGILLDMVGAKGARFPLEQISYAYAAAVQQRVWQAAATAGFSSYFVFQDGGAITDDHVFVNTLAGIPTVDIINLDPASDQPFAPHWHTHGDDMSVIDKNTLEAVGETLLQVIYEMAQPAT